VVVTIFIVVVLSLLLVCCKWSNAVVAVADVWLILIVDVVGLLQS